MNEELTEQAQRILRDDPTFADDVRLDRAVNEGTEAEAIHAVLVQRLIDWLDPKNKMSSAELMEAEAMIEAGVDWDGLDAFIPWEE